MRSRFTATIAVALLVLGCSPGPSPSPSAGADGSAVTRYALPADSWLTIGPGETARACAGVGLDAIVRGSPTDPRHVWLADSTTGHRIDLVWPTGYTARFAPDVEVLDTSGGVVLRAGQRIDGGCVTGRDNVLWLPNW